MPISIEEADLLAREEIERLNKIVKCRFYPPTILWNLRGTNAGMALRETGMIRLNPQLCLFDKKEIIETTAHEYAHVCQPFKSRNHGEEWKILMRIFGYYPKVTHSLPLKAARREKRVTMICPSCSHLWSTRNRLLKRYTFSCSRCSTLGNTVHLIPTLDHFFSDPPSPTNQENAL